MSYPVETDEHGNAKPPMGEKELSERLRRRFLRYAKKLEKTKPDLAKRVRERIDDLVAWYVEHQRDMTPEEFEKVIGIYV